MQDTAASRAPDRMFAALVSAGYLLVGLAWIGFSDQAGSVLFSSSEALTRFQTYKGVGFVCVTALLVFVLAARASRRPTGNWQPGRSRAGLSALLTCLVLVTAVPLVAMLGYNVVRQTRATMHEADALVQGLAQATGARAQAYLEDRQRLAQLLAQRPVAGSACDEMLPEGAALLEDIVDMLVLDAAGNVRCSVRGGAGVPLPASRFARQATMLLSPPGADDVPPVVALTSPLRDGGQVTGSVQLLLAATRFDRVAAGTATAGVSIALVTLQGEVLARAPAGDVPPEAGRAEALLLARALEAGRQSVLVRGDDGAERLHALRVVPGTNLLVTAALGIDDAFEAARLQALRAFGTAALVVLLGALLVALIVRRIAVPMRALAKTAEAVAAGELARRAPEAGPAEVVRVAVEFNRMLDRLPALEHELRESEVRHRTLLEKLSHNIPGMIFQLCMEPDGRAWLPFASEAGERMLELTPAQLHGDASAAFSRIHPDDVALAMDTLQRSRAELSRIELRHRMVLPRAGLRYYLTAAQPELEPGGACLWHGCTVDVTSLEEARMALRQANATLEARVAERTRELAAANESLESFSYSVAHDLRAPLAAIEGFTGALPAALDKGDGPRVARLAERVAANTRQMGAMIDGLLEVARAGKGELREAPVDLSRLVGNVLAELAPPSTTAVEVAPLPTVLADAVTLRQVWWNLLANAVKFTAHRPQGRIAVGWEQRGQELVFSVRDNGAGFDPDYAGRLFTAFQRLHDAREFEGTGIGLALVRRVVERHGGRAWAEGRPDAGAAFFFSLPASRLPAGSTA